MDVVVRSPRLPAPGETLMGGGFGTHPGGKGANQAVAAARMGAAVRMIGAVGLDAHGAEMRRVLGEAGVDVAGVAQRAGVATGVAVITVAESAENTIVVSAGANATVLPADVDAAEEVIGSADVLLLQMEVQEEAVLRAAQIGKERGVTVILNAAPARKLSWDLLASLDVLIVNESEAALVLAAATMGADAGEMAALAVEERLDRLARLGVPCVIMTEGARGASFVRERVSRNVPAFAVTPVDTVGAGDAFCGVLAARWAEHQVGGRVDAEAVQDAVTWACAGGAIATMKEGAIGSLPVRGEIVKMLCGR